MSFICKTFGFKHGHIHIITYYLWSIWTNVIDKDPSLSRDSVARVWQRKRIRVHQSGPLKGTTVEMGSLYLDSKICTSGLQIHSFYWSGFFVATKDWRTVNDYILSVQNLHQAFQFEHQSIFTSKVFWIELYHMKNQLG